MMGRIIACIGVQRKTTPIEVFLSRQLTPGIARKIYDKKTTIKVSIMEPLSHTSLFRQSRDSLPLKLNSRSFKQKFTNSDLSP